jgi:hypothetical protein
MQHRGRLGLLTLGLPPRTLVDLDGYYWCIGCDFRFIFDKLIRSIAYWLEVPPPARGWSPDIVHGKVSVEGSPACAGMVRLLINRHKGIQWFPRLSGDGPFDRKAAERAPEVPPPARGWSLSVIDR